MMVRFYHLGGSNSVSKYFSCVEFLYWARVWDWMISKNLLNSSFCDSVAISSHLSLSLEIPVDVKTA